MSQIEAITLDLHGMYHDLLRSADGRVIWDSGWHKNTIVSSCRSLLAGFMRGDPPSTGIEGLQVGVGLDAWDRPPGLPVPDSNRTNLVDPNAYTVDLTHIKIDYLDGSTVTNNPTNRLQIVATLGPHIPDWPDEHHPTSTLREFGLVGKINNNRVLINYVAHTAIAKDPFSTLERTIWLVF